jgi:glyoxalase family protein
MQSNETQLGGLHHVTAIVDDPQQNVAFYRDVLGLRMIKQTVNFDDPSTYHLYFGDEEGSPGSILTFFPWVGIRRASRGSGQISAIALAMPEAALPFWSERLESFGIRASDPAPRFGQAVISLYDPAGLLLELVAQPAATERPAWEGGPVPTEYAIRGMAGITLVSARPAHTAAALGEALGFREAASEGNRTRYLVGQGSAEAYADVEHRPDLPYGQMGAGSVHHVAWRTADDEQQRAWQRHLSSSGIAVTPVRDRQYFHSIYFHEPGGALFEIATDGPGFTIDEPLEELGTRLMLPPWYAERRAEIERVLPPLNLAAQEREV